MRQNPQILLLLQMIGNGVEYSTYMERHGGAVLNEVGNIPADPVYDFVIGFIFPFNQGQIAFDNKIDTAQMNHRLAVGYRHVGIDFGNHQRCLFNDNVGHIHRNTQRYKTLVVRRGCQNNRDIDRHRST
ncbi:MAG: hypothetical protein BWX99_02613 [Deltaproteobacteria bacterium ADurb.Bin151]|nr:MAG: hypothetical protein BWX99_02613 [Deltaproteobacteria bacterium ADurb.Bin151]